MKQHFFDLLRLWLRNYFRHPVENIRQARPIIPGRLYSNFGNICKAVPYTAEQKKWIAQMKEEVVELTPGYSPEFLLEWVRQTGGDLKYKKQIERLVTSQDTPPRCILCDFHDRGIPCPIYNELPPKGSSVRIVCDEYRYVIIKPVSNL